jgi:outer membrane protein OmpA-like peptidoglycan-associated protein
MSANLGRAKFKFICSVTAAGLILGAGINFARAAEQNSADDIVKALTPKGLTRSLSTSPADAARTAEQQRFIDTLRNRKTRSLSSGEREQVATLAKDKPSVDLEINFDFNSDVIGKSGQAKADDLGKALSNPTLKGSTFLVAGHTDAKGGEEFNQELSDRRAEAVKRFLTEKYGIAGANLVTVGYGETRLKNKDNPRAPENRRVQVVNIAESKVADK